MNGRMLAWVAVVQKDAAAPSTPAATSPAQAERVSIRTVRPNRASVSAPLSAENRLARSARLPSGKQVREQTAGEGI